MCATQLGLAETYNTVGNRIERPNLWRVPSLLKLDGYATPSGEELGRHFR